MAVTLSLLSQEVRGQFGALSRYQVNLVLSSTYPTGGDTVDFSTLPLIKTSRAPVNVDVAGVVAGYHLEWIPGTTQKNGKLKIYVDSGAGSPGTELGAGGYPGALTSATNINLEAMFRKNI